MSKAFRIITGVLIGSFMLTLGLVYLINIPDIENQHYQTNTETTISAPKNDCNFFYAPIGEKGCHYKMTTIVIHHFISNGREAIQTDGYEDGSKTVVWSANPALATYNETLCYAEKVKD